jgi:hypothetical protein
VTYLRESYSLVKESLYIFNSTLTMLVSSREDLDRFGPICSNVKEMCQFIRASLEGDVLPKGQLNKSEPTLPKFSMCVAVYSQIDLKTTMR